MIKYRREKGRFMSEPDIRKRQKELWKIKEVREMEALRRELIKRSTNPRVSKDDIKNIGRKFIGGVNRGNL